MACIDPAKLYDPTYRVTGIELALIYATHDARGKRNLDVNIEQWQ